MTEVRTTLRTAYLAGPMRGHDDFNFPEFHKQAAWLRGLGWKVFSPAERDEDDEYLNGDWGIDKTHGLDYFMQFDLAAVCRMDCVVLMKGWENSQGARLEAATAVEIRHPVFEITYRGDDGSRILTSVDPDFIKLVFFNGGQGVDGEESQTLSFIDEEHVIPDEVVEGLAALFAHESVFDRPGIGILTTAEEAVTIPEEESISSDEFTTISQRVQALANEPLTGLYDEMSWYERPPDGVVDTEELSDPKWHLTVEIRPEDQPILGGPIRAFDTGATRNVEVDPDLYGFTSPLALAMFGEYMHEKRTQADGSVRDSDNWKKGIPLESYIRSMFRHMQDVRLIHDGHAELARDGGDMHAAICGLFFNVQGYMHEWAKEFIAAKGTTDQEGTT